MEKKWFVLMSLILALMASGCAAAAPSRELGRPQVVEKEAIAIVEEAEGARHSTVGYSIADAEEVLATATQDRMIIYTVEMELIVKDTAETMAQIESLATEMGGFVSGSNSWKDEDQMRARVTLRVPADKLDEALIQIRGLAMDVESESRDSDDVTEQFTDLDAQLRNRQAYEEELFELLKERREASSDTEDILEVYRELTRIRGEIEQIQGKMNYLSNLSAMATIHIGLTPDALVQPLVLGKWQPQGTARQAIRSLISALEFLVDALIWILVFVVPVLVVILLPLFLILRALINWRRKRRRPTA